MQIFTTFQEWGQSRTLYISKGCLNSSDEEPNLKCIWRRQFDSLVLMNFQMSYSSGCSRLVVEKNFQENIPKYPPFTHMILKLTFRTGANRPNQIFLPSKPTPTPWIPLKHFALYPEDYLDGSSQTHEMPFRRQRPFLWSLKCVNNNPGALYKSLSQGVKKVRNSERIKTAT